MKKIFKIAFVICLALVIVIPFITFAQDLPSLPGPGQYQVYPAPSNGLGQRIDSSYYANLVICTGEGIGNLLCNIHKLLNSVIPILLALGVVYFVWGVVQYVIGDSEEAKKKGRDHVVYGIIGFAIILSVWGLVALVVNTFNLGAQTVSVPSLVPTSTAAVGGGCDLGNSPKVQDVLKYGTCVIQNSVIPLMFALAIAFFIWGVIQFLILGAGEEAKRTQGRQHMIWGIIALAVMLGVWSLVGIIGGTFGLNTSVLPGVKPGSGNTQ